MSGYPSGPFGQSGETPYQLPPPRAPANSQFGTDPFLRQRAQGENTEQDKDSKSIEPVSQTQPQRTEQLPSVRHLLTPVTGPTSPPSYHQSFGTTTPGTDHREYTYPFRQHDPTHVSPISPILSSDKTKGRSESFPQPQTGTLPPLSQVALHSPRDVKHAMTRSDPSSTSFQHSQLPYHGVPYHEQPLSLDDLSSPESAGRTKGQSVLPHVIDERYIEGEGICYVYANGAHVPKLIDGIPVNANWGVTKAGKPRKRLAQACLTCREKKIKCHPNLPKCDQCQKSGRECRFESAPRGSRSSLRGSNSAGPSSRYDASENFSPGPQTSETSTSIYNIPRASNSATSLPGTSGYSPLSEGPLQTPSVTEPSYDPMSDAERVYRSRMYKSPRAYGTGEEGITRTSDYADAGRSEYSDIFGDIGDINPDDPLAAFWGTDPYETDPEMTIHYIESYMSSVNGGLYHIFPRSRFVAWLKSCRAKSAEDKMLLYAMLALGSIFSDRPDRIGTLKRYVQVARFAIFKSQHALSLQLAQSHLIMSLLYYATGFLARSWDSIGAAGRAVSGLRYNVESGGVIVDQSQICDYGLHPQALIECRRRTYWVAFILDRVSSFFSASSTFISSESALIRLPCHEDIYEAQQYATAPYFQPVLNQAPPGEDNRSALSPMAFLVQIMAIWGDVSLNILRLAHTPSEGYARLAEDFHSIITHRTEEWMKCLPEDLKMSAINLERAAQVKQVDILISIHIFYHATLMKLYRHARHSTLRPDILVQYIHRARYHAVESLRVALTIIPYLNTMQSRSNADVSGPNTTIISPFIGYVILSAVDVLSAAGLVTELPDCVPLISGALSVVQLLVRHWESSLSLASSIQRRLNLMIDSMNDRVRIQDKVGFVVNASSLEAKAHTDVHSAHPRGALDEDLFYGSMPKEMLLNAMRVDETAITEHNIIWLKDL
ncbi:hypothetical protein N7456_005270 [Penicillium angulare]|uniref:Zn(2)-C6 fungal-type domain-containing protein n=1 Tax=Penicillium angulare TaxID=116970 RepID=A0A9W9FY47_9EURO|nr:hypothetical protein N7456_005270 [Penicillium angulare]